MVLPWRSCPTNQATCSVRVRIVMYLSRTTPFDLMCSNATSLSRLRPSKSLIRYNKVEYGRVRPLPRHDSKSREGHPSCGFNSHLRHHRISRLEVRTASPMRGSLSCNCAVSRRRRSHSDRPMPVRSPAGCGKATEQRPWWALERLTKSEVNPRRPG